MHTAIFVWLIKFVKSTLGEKLSKQEVGLSRVSRLLFFIKFEAAVVVVVVVVVVVITTFDLIWMNPLSLLFV